MRWTPLIVAALLAAAGCGPKDAPAGGAGDAGTVKIGVAGPVTGGQAKNGEDLVDGTTMAMEEWNAKGGVLGRKIEIVVRDDMADPKLAPVAAGQLVDQKVVGVVGHFNSGSTIPASEIYNNAGIVSITPASTNEFVTDRKLPLVFRVCGRDDQQSPAAANYIADVMKAKRVAIFNDKTAYGKGLADGVERNLKGRVEVVLSEGFDKAERNFRPYLSKLKDANVDVWFFGGIFEQAAPLLLQARQVGITAPMMSGDGVHGYQKDFIDKVGAGAEGTLTTFLNTEGAPGYAAFVARYRARFEGKEPGPYAMYSYSAASILLAGIEQAKSTDGVKLGAAIHAGTYDLPMGKVTFDAKGDVNSGGYVVWVVKGGRHTVVGK
ncbi:MAG: branched-chain amino acid ABC transporter substrate-binding protein [Planctomycetes bacterium]|nr:branched-chain amino acid ABC transporter substrate-binding protein [Planctomycetota bacterium]